MAESPNNPLPGKGVLGWLGRQVGYVAKAMRTDVAAPAQPRVIYQDRRVEHQPHPEQPGVVLRRTVVDEVVVHPPTTPPDDVA